MIRYLILLLVLTSAAYGAELKTPISIINLISTPDKFDGKIVRILGYGLFNNHSTVVCLHRDDIEFGLSKNCLWIGLNKEVIQKAQELSGSYVDLEGLFVKNKSGYMSTASGIIKEVKAIYSSTPNSGYSSPNE